MTVKLLTEHHLGFLSLKGGCRGSPESTLVQMSNCWKSHAGAHIVVLTETWLTPNKKWNIMIPNLDAPYRKDCNKIAITQQDVIKAKKRI